MGKMYGFTVKGQSADAVATLSVGFGGEGYSAKPDASIMR